MRRLWLCLLLLAGWSLPAHAQITTYAGPLPPAVGGTGINSSGLLGTATIGSGGTPGVWSVGEVPALRADTFAGADEGAKIQAAHDAAACISGACVIDATAFRTGTITSLTVTKAVELHMCGAWTLNGTITWQNVPARLIGCGRAALTFTWNGAALLPAMDLQAAGLGAYLSGFKIAVAAGKQLTRAIRIGNYSTAQTVLSSQMNLKSVYIEGYSGGYGKVTQGIVFDPLVQPKTPQGVNPLNNTTSPITITVDNCTGWPAPASDYFVFIDDPTNEELAVATGARCTGTSLTMTRASAVAHTGNPKIKYVMNQNNDVSIFEDVSVNNYAAEGILILGDQSMRHLWTRVVADGGQQAGTYGVRTGYSWNANRALLSGGDFNCRECTVQGNDIDYYLYSTGAGNFTIAGGNSENSTRWVEMLNPAGAINITLTGQRWATNRLNADNYPIKYKGAGTLTVANNVIQGYIQANYLTVTNIANNGSGKVRVTVGSHGMSTGDYVIISNIYISGGGGVHEANGLWQITRIDNNTFDLPVNYVNTWGGTGNAYKGQTQLYCEVQRSCVARDNLIASALPDPFFQTYFWRKDNNLSVSADLWPPTNTARLYAQGGCVTIPSGSTSASVREGNCFITANAAPTTLSSFTEISPGQTFSVLIQDANTTIGFSGTFIRGNSTVDLKLNIYDSLSCVGTTSTTAVCVISMNYSSPAAIGGTTPAAGSFTTLGASGQITSTLATGTAPLVVASTTQVANLNVSQLIGGTWATPGTIGSSTPNTGAFASLTGTLGGSTTQGQTSKAVACTITKSSPTGNVEENLATCTVPASTLNVNNRLLRFKAIWKHGASTNAASLTIRWAGTGVNGTIITGPNSNSASGTVIGTMGYVWRTGSNAQTMASGAENGGAGNTLNTDTQTDTNPVTVYINGTTPTATTDLVLYQVFMEVLGP